MKKLWLVYEIFNICFPDNVNVFETNVRIGIINVRHLSAAKYFKNGAQSLRRPV